MNVAYGSVSEWRRIEARRSRVSAACVGGRLGNAERRKRERVRCDGIYDGRASWRKRDTETRGRERSSCITGQRGLHTIRAVHTRFTLFTRSKRSTFASDTQRGPLRNALSLCIDRFHIHLHRIQLKTAHCFYRMEHSGVSITASLSRR